jgi:hypothetical protein
MISRMHRRPSKAFLGGIVGQAGRSTLPLGEAYYIAVHDFARLSDAFVVMMNQHSQRCEDWMIRR